MFGDLIAMKQGNVEEYSRAFDTLSAWLKQCPMKTNNYGPFFEDITDYSNTEINADTLAMYILEHPEWDKNWRKDARAILDWSFNTFRNDKWSSYGVMAINEQTAYQAPGNSHTSRHYSVELLYAEKTGDTSRKEQAIRGLNWATYMVDSDGKNRYPNDDVWLTDGYGDYVRHYLRAMAAAPELAPRDQCHLLRTSSVIRDISYGEKAIAYATFDGSSRELFRVNFEPAQVMAASVALEKLPSRSNLDVKEGYTYHAPGDVPGVLRIRRDNRPGVVTIMGK